MGVPPENHLTHPQAELGLSHTVIFFTFLGTVPIPVQLGKIALFSLQLGKIAPLNLYEITQAGNVMDQYQEQ